MGKQISNSSTTVLDWTSNLRLDLTSSGGSLYRFSLANDHLENISDIDRPYIYAIYIIKAVKRCLPSFAIRRINCQRPLDMSTNFLSLPSELRNSIYEILLVHQQPIICPTHPWIKQSPPLALTPGLFRTNKIIHYEASSMLYSMNRFDFTKCPPEVVVRFLEQIGRKNASYILHISLDFPKLCDLELHQVNIEDDSIHILTKIQSDCVNLATLTTSLDSTNAMEVNLRALNYPKIVAEVLTLVDAGFRAILSLQEIIVKVYKDGPNDDIRRDIRREMKLHGWTISATEYEEQSDFDFDYDDMMIMIPMRTVVFGEGR